MPTLGEISGQDAVVGEVVSSTEAASPIELTFLPEDHLFELRVKNATYVSYLLEYTSLNEDGKKIRHAINKSGKTNSLNRYKEALLAGTESNGQQFLHDVTGGSLKLITTNLDDSKTEYMLAFEVNEEGELKVTSTNSKETQVANVVVEKPPGPEVKAAVFDGDIPTSQAQVAHPSVETPWYQSWRDLDQMKQYLPLIIIIGVSVVAVAMFAIVKTRRSMPKGLSRKMA